VTKRPAQQAEPGFSRQERLCFSEALRYARGYALERRDAQSAAGGRRVWETAYLAFKDHFRMVEAAGKALSCDVRRTLPDGARRAYLGLVFVTEARTGRTGVEALSRVLAPAGETLAEILAESDAHRKVLEVLEAMRK